MSDNPRAEPETAPVTTTGAAKGGRLNAARHGLYSTAIVIPKIEDPDEWEAFRASVIASQNPVGSVETALAERIAELLWRRRRVARAEQQAVVSAQHRDHAVRGKRKFDVEAARKKSEARGEPPDSEWRSMYAADHYVDANRGPRLMPAESTLDQIIRYESHLNRQLYHALHELEAMQQRRQGQPSPLARVDVHGLPGA
jgi:hypothetical protein